MIRTQIQLEESQVLDRDDLHYTLHACLRYINEDIGKAWKTVSLILKGRILSPE